MKQSEFLAITCDLPKVQKKFLLQGLIGFGFGFGFASHLLKNCRIFRGTTKLSNPNHMLMYLCLSLKGAQTH